MRKRFLYECSWQPEPAAERSNTSPINGNGRFQCEVSKADCSNKLLSLTLAFVRLPIVLQTCFIEVDRVRHWIFRINVFEPVSQFMKNCEAFVLNELEFVHFDTNATLASCVSNQTTRHASWQCNQVNRKAHIGS